MDPRQLRRLPSYVYMQDLLRGRRVLEIGCGEGHAAHFLLRNGAQAVVGVDRSSRAIDAARTRYRVANLEFRVADYAGLELEDRSFDVVCVPIGAELVRWLGFLEEARRVLAKEGVLLTQAGSADRPDARGGLSYHELVDRLEPLFGRVRMVGLAPFVGFSLVEFGDEEGEIPELELDTSLLALGAGQDGIVEYVAMAGRTEGTPRGFTVVQLPAVDGLDAIAEVVGEGVGVSAGAQRAAEARVREAEAVAAEAQARLRDLEQEVTQAQRRQVSRTEETDLRRRLARAVEERTAADAEAQVLRTRVGQAEEEIGRVAAQAALELGELKEQAAALKARVAELEAQAAAEFPDVPTQDIRPLTAAPAPAGDPLAVAKLELALREREDELARAVSERQELAWRVAELEGARGEAPGGEAAPAAPAPMELLGEAAVRHEQALAEASAVLEERDAYIDELRDDLERVTEEARLASAAAAEARALATRLDGELRDVRGRAARAEGATIRLRGGLPPVPTMAPLVAPAAPPPPAAPAEPAPPVAAPDAALAARVAELEAAVADRTAAVDKATVRWKEAEAKSDELWRKIGEMQKELEQQREQAVENARAQRQAAQVALTRAMDEASKKLVSVQDNFARTEKERAALERTVGELKGELGAVQAAQGDAASRLRADHAVAESRLRAELEDALAAVTRRRSTDATIAIHLDALTERLETIDQDLRAEEARLGQLEDDLRGVHGHAALIPDSTELERALVDRAAADTAREKALTVRDERIRELMAELGQRDAEIALMHAKVGSAKRRVADLLDAVRRTREQVAGRSPVEIAAMLDRLAAEAAEAGAAPADGHD